MINLKKKSYKITSIRLESDLLRIIKKVAKQNGVSVNKVIEAALKDEFKEILVNSLIGGENEK